MASLIRASSAAVASAPFVARGWLLMMCNESVMLWRARRLARRDLKVRLGEDVHDERAQGEQMACPGVGLVVGSLHTGIAEWRPSGNQYAYCVASLKIGLQLLLPNVCVGGESSSSNASTETISVFATAWTNYLIALPLLQQFLLRWQCVAATDKASHVPLSLG